MSDILEPFTSLDFYHISERSQASVAKITNGSKPPKYVRKYNTRYTEYPQNTDQQYLVDRMFYSQSLGNLTMDS